MLLGGVFFSIEIQELTIRFRDKQFPIGTQITVAIESLHIQRNNEALCRWPEFLRGIYQIQGINDNDQPLYLRRSGAFQSKLSFA